MTITAEKANEAKEEFKIIYEHTLFYVDKIKID